MLFNVLLEGDSRAGWEAKSPEERLSHLKSLLAVALRKELKPLKTYAQWASGDEPGIPRALAVGASNSQNQVAKIETMTALRGWTARSGDRHPLESEPQRLPAVGAEPPTPSL